MAIHYNFDERFAEGFLHKPHRVFGKKLKPFSTWHRLQLEWVNSRILTGGPTKWDVYAAVKICQSQYPDAADVETYKGIRAFVWKLRYLFTPWRKEAKKFFAYIDDYYSPPKLWGGKSSSKKKLAEAAHELYLVTNNPADLEAANRITQQVELEDGGENQIDDTLSAVAAYIKYTHRPPHEGWNMACGELAWITVALAKMEGAEIAVWTPLDEYHFQNHLKVRAKNIAEKAEEIAKENPEMPQEIVNALAPVKYWDEVCQKLTK